MQFFPQLSSGATAQFPLVKRISNRTVVNSHRDGSRVQLSDPNAYSTEWRLELSDLSDDEADALEELFRATDGRYGEFTFLDPTDNLLSWSDSLDAGVWTKDPGLVLMLEVPDPFGGTRASRIQNTSQLSQALRQRITCASQYQYCTSVYLRSQVNTTVTLLGADGRQPFKASAEWRRCELRVMKCGTDDHADFGIELKPGTVVEVYGFQVEPSAGATVYKRTTTRSGVHLNARFSDDQLEIVTAGPGRHSCTVRIRAPR